MDALRRRDDCPGRGADLSSERRGSGQSQPQHQAAAQPGPASAAFTLQHKAAVLEAALSSLTDLRLAGRVAERGREAAGAASRYSADRDDEAPSSTPAASAGSSQAGEGVTLVSGNSSTDKRLLRVANERNEPAAVRLESAADYRTPAHRVLHSVPRVCS